MAARNSVLDRDIIKPDAEICSLRTHLGGAGVQIVAPARLQRFTELGVAGPARAVGQAQFHTQETASQFTRAPHQLRHISHPRFIDVLTQPHELDIPRRDHSARLARFQRGISLFEHLAVTPPLIDVLMFHVKHTPVQESPATTGTLFDQPVNLRINDLNRQRSGELGQGGHSLPGHFPSDTQGRTFNAKPDSALRQVHLTVDDETLAASANQSIQPPRTK